MKSSPNFTCIGLFLLTLLVGTALTSSQERRVLQTCTASSCVSCSNTDASFCLTCVDGYVANGGVCSKCPTNCKTCYSTDASICITCNPGYMLASGSKSCPVDDGSTTVRTPENTVEVKDSGFKNFHVVIVVAGIVYFIGLVIGIVARKRTDSVCKNHLKQYERYAGSSEAYQPRGDNHTSSGNHPSDPHSQPLRPIPMNGKQTHALPPGFQ